MRSLVGTVGVYVGFAFTERFGRAFAGVDFGFEAFFGDEQMVIALPETVGFVADVLKEFLGRRWCGESLMGPLRALDENFLFPLGQRDHHWRADVHFGKRGLGGVELAEAAVDEDHVGIKFGVLAGFAVAAGDDFLDGFVVINSGDGFDAVAAIAVF